MMGKTPQTRLKEQYDSYESLINDIVHSLSTSIGMADYIRIKAIELYDKMQPITHTLPHKMAVDCVYLAANAEGVRASVRGIQAITKGLYGFNIRPETHKWVMEHIDDVCETLKCNMADLPLRGRIASVDSSE